MKLYRSKRTTLLASLCMCLAVGVITTTEAFGTPTNAVTPTIHVSRNRPSLSVPSIRKEPFLKVTRMEHNDLSEMRQRSVTKKLATLSTALWSSVSVWRHSKAWMAPATTTATVSTLLATRGGGAVVTPAPWVQFFGQLGPIASIFFLLAPMPTIRQMSEKKSVGDLPLLPYSSMMVNCFLWLLYGGLKREIRLWGVNLIGLILGIFYTMRYLQVAEKTPKPASELVQMVEEEGLVDALDESKTQESSSKNQAQLIGGAVIMTAASALAIASKWWGSRAVNAIGNACVVLCLAMMASPLSTLNTVISKRNAESIPLPFTLATLVNCFSWSVWGIFAMRDPNVYVPNVLGFTSGMVQVFLKLYYGNGPNEKKAETPAPEGGTN